MPAISVTGTEDWLGEWTFALPQGSMTDEPIFWAQLLAKGGHDDGRVPRRAVAHRRVATSGTSARRAATSGIRIVAEEHIPQTAQDVDRGGRGAPRRQAGRARALRLRLRRRLREPGAARRSAGTRRASWGPPSRTRGSTRCIWDAIVGWTGLDQYDEDEPGGPELPRRVRPAYGRRPEYCVPVVNRDLATVLLHAFADAHPLSAPEA